MAFDALIMKAITLELAEKLDGAIVQRVNEPARGETALHFYGRGGRQILLYSVDPQYSRLHLTEEEKRKKEADTSPSPFCMLLRKYLTGSRAASFSSPPLERILTIEFNLPDGMAPVQLIAEVMGRRSNLILVDHRGIILGAAKPVSGEKNPIRPILPGEPYLPVPTQERLNPLLMEREEFAQRYSSAIAGGKKQEQALLSSIAGLSPLIARELIFRAGKDQTAAEDFTDRLYRETVALFKSAERGAHRAVAAPEQKLIAAAELTHLPAENQVRFDSVNTMLDRFYSKTIRVEREKALRGSLAAVVKKRITTLEKKKKGQKEDLASAEQAPQYRLYGELLLAYGHQAPRGASSIELPDLYDPAKTVTVPLDPSKTAAANAQRYFTRYRKAKKGLDEVKKQLRKTAAELKYCRELLYAIENSSGLSLEEIRTELVQAGYMKAKKGVKARKEARPEPLSFRSSAGHTILVGRNNRQNDYITFKAAVRRDTWFHVRIIPGSHVVLKEAPDPIPPSDIEEAAFLAAYFSKGRNSGAVEVDYTAVRHVRRRPGGKPGQVFYENYDTITVNPQDQRLIAYFNLLAPEG